MPISRRGATVVFECVNAMSTLRLSQTFWFSSDSHLSNKIFGRAVVIVVSGLLVGCSLLSGNSGEEPRQERGVDPSGVSYVADGVCAECHEEAVAAWQNSHHDLAMQDATSETVQGDFDDTTFTHFGVTSRFFREGERFFVNTEGPDGELADFELLYTFGVEPLQQYLSPFPGGRLQSLSIAWDTEKKAWFHLYPDERIMPEDPLHWTGRYQNWNHQCAACHSTDLRKRYDRDSDTYRTTWAEIDVGCQACHGPGGDHVALVGNGERTFPGGELGLVAPFSSNDAGREVDTCAPCHSRREALTPVAAHGGSLLDDYLPSRLQVGLYHSDGQILDEVYVYGSFVQSKMHAAGVRCSNCHDPHTLSVRSSGNTLCTQCHRATAVERFPTLQPGNYDTSAHHHHPEGTAGAQCINCHMPDRTYMVVDPRRDHSFRVPRPDLSERLGTPNACITCHGDRDDRWAAQAVADWFGAPAGPHFSGALAAGRRSDQSAVEDLVALSGDTTQSGIVRATALELLQQFGGVGVGAARELLGDPDPLVRVTAAGGVESLPLPMRRVALQPLLEDPVRAVRIEAARSLAEIWTEALGRDPLTSAVAEYLDAEAASADMPPAHLRLGIVRERQGDVVQAETEYRTALTLDPWFIPARFNLANLLNRGSRNAEAEAVLRVGLDYAPEDGELHYSLGLLLAEAGRFEESGELLAEAAGLTNRARVHYNHGLALQRLARLEDAEAALRRARTLDTADPDIVFALARLLVERRQWPEARRFASELVRLLPMAPGPRRLLNDIQLMEQRSRR